MNRILPSAVLFICGAFALPTRAGELMTATDRDAAQAKPMPMNMSPGTPMGSMMPHPGFRFYGWLETGITFNPDSPDDHQNFGRLFDDRANEPLLNQFVLSASIEDF